jgi:hypothetical protein
LNSKSELCKLAASRLGTNVDVSDIDSPGNAPERVFAKWYDQTRELVLKILAPNFALGRALVAKSSMTPAFGPAYYYDKPSDCLRVLGVGEIQDKENTTSVEGDYILSDDDYTDGMPIRYVKDIKDVTKFSPEFVNLMSFQLAYDCCIELTKDSDKLLYLEKIMPAKLSGSSALNGFENRPIRINHSKFRQARTTFWPSTETKR